MTLLDLAEILEAAAEKARDIAARQAADKLDWIDQTTSVLGRRRHIAAVRRRLAAGLTGAAVKGRRYLLSKPALDEELQRPPDANEEQTDVAEALRGELRAITGGRS